MYMNKLKFSILAFAGVLFGCQQAELTEPVGQSMKTVTISTEMGGDETKAAIEDVNDPSVLESKALSVKLYK